MGHRGEHVEIEAPAFVHETALLYGNITIGEASSVFAHVVMRAELYDITIGRRVNIQEHVVIQVGDFTPTVIGDDCSITCRATLRGCAIGDRTLIGVGATVLDGARIGANSIVAGHALVDKNAVFEDNSVIAGVPAKKIGERDNSEVTLLNSNIYQAIAQNYAKGVERLSEAQLKQILAQAKA